MTDNDLQRRIERARRIIGWYTLTATGTGGIPVPASSAVIVMNNGLMMAHIAAEMKEPISWPLVLKCLGTAGVLNSAGRALFIEVAKLLSWGTGNVWAMPALCAAGATTAGLQTYAIGMICLEIAKNGGNVLPAAVSTKVIEDARASFGRFVAEMKGEDLVDPSRNMKLRAELART